MRILPDDLRALINADDFHTPANAWLSRVRAAGDRDAARQANRDYDMAERMWMRRRKAAASADVAKGGA